MWPQKLTEVLCDKLLSGVRFGLDIESEKMQLTITTLSDQLFNIEVSEDLELENFKAMCQVETGVPASEMSIVWNGRPLHDDKLTLKQYGIHNGDMVLIQHLRGQVGRQSSGSSASNAGKSSLLRTLTTRSRSRI